MKKLLTLSLACGMFAFVGCGDPPKTPVKKDEPKKVTPAAPAAEEKKADDKMEEKKDKPK